jgi:hypothetical protein
MDLSGEPLLNKELINNDVWVILRVLQGMIKASVQILIGEIEMLETKLSFQADALRLTDFVNGTNALECIQVDLAI